MNILEGSRKQPSENTCCSQRKQGVVIRALLSFQWRPKYRGRAKQKAGSLGAVACRTDVLSLDLGWFQRAPMAFGKEGWSSFMGLN